MNKSEQKFIAIVWEYYKKHKRHTLPWRKTNDPYLIMVSEIMLQQTQVDRVIPKYEVFIKTFPTIKSLAKAPLASVLSLWQGLGYNRRAKMLHECAKAVTKAGGSFPRTKEALLALPGIGAYTAGAILAFAYNEPTPIIETNIRTVYLHHFFKDRTDVSDKELFTVIQTTLDTNRPREWYYALMDYGAYLKKTVGVKNNQSKHYTKQSTFKDSDRQIRGAIIRALVEKRNHLTRAELHALLGQFIDIRIDSQLQSLTNEGLISLVKGRYTLPT